MRTGVPIAILDRTDFKTKIVTREKEGHFLIIKGSFYQEYIKVINTEKPNNRAPKYIKQTLTKLKGEIDNTTTAIGVFNTLLSIMDKTIRQKTKQEIVSNTTD